MQCVERSLLPKAKISSTTHVNCYNGYMANNNNNYEQFPGKLSRIDVEKAADFVRSCLNFDGGFGSRPGAESHAGQIIFSSP